MYDLNSQRSWLRSLLVTVCALLATSVGADQDPLDLLVGRWDVRVETTRPRSSVLTYSEVYEWVLDRHFLMGRTLQKSDGTEDIVYGTYDARADGYPFWIFSSTGTYTYLAPGKWDARKRRWTWTNPANTDIYYNTQVDFPDDDTRRWSVLVKDWKGTVILEQEGVATRRSD